jgi:hypothetical protein
MKPKVLVASFLFGVGLSAAIAGQPDARFDGIWVGVETYVIYGHAGAGAQEGWGPVKKPTVIGIADYGKTFAVGQGFQQGRFEISPSWGKNTLRFSVISGPSLYGSLPSWSRLPPLARPAYYGRTRGELVMSADGNALTETAVAVLLGRPSSVTCNISGTFHRQGKN